DGRRRFNPIKSRRKRPNDKGQEKAERNKQKQSDRFDVLDILHSHSPPTSSSNGSVKKMVVPFPYWLSAQIWPPCALIISFEMARPRPVPPIARERARSTR